MFQKRQGNILCAAVFFLLAASASAQRHKVSSIDAETSEGKALQSLGQETDVPKRITLMEEFAAKYPKHESASWVLSQLQSAHAEAGNLAKALNAGEQLLGLDPMDIEAAYANLKPSEGLKDSEGVLKWSGATSEIARKTVASPKGADQSAATRRSIVRSRSISTLSIPCTPQLCRKRMRRRP